MMTLRQLAAEPPTLPTRTTWYLTDLAEARGKQELFTRQSPQKLKVLREHALIESAISSSRIEGVEVDKSRVGTLLFGKPASRGLHPPLNALMEPQTKIDTSPFILSTSEPERKVAILLSSPGFRLHRISARQVNTTGDCALKGEL